MNHLNKQISQLGRAIALAAIAHKSHKGQKGTFQTTTMFSDDNRPLLLQIYTKRHQYIAQEQMEMTGMNTDTLQRLQAQLKTLKLPDAVVCFVDSKYKQVYAGRLSKLMGLETFFGTSFPYYKASPGGGRIIMWPVHAMPSVAPIPEKQLQQLLKLQSDDESDPKQTHLF